MDDKNCDVAHERELRELWQENHENRHLVEHKALEASRQDIERRLDEMNQLRKQIDQERGQFLLRDYYDREHSTLRDMFNVRIDTLRDSDDARLKAVENAKSNLEGRLWGIGAVITVVVVLVQIGLHFLGAK